jgi:hypothetical protein
VLLSNEIALKQGIGVKFIAMEHEHRARFAGWLKTLSS